MDYTPPDDSPDLTSLFLNYSVNGVMDPPHFQEFLVQVQHESSTDAIQDEEEASSSSTPRFKKKRDFVEYLFDVQQNCAIHSRVHHDMTAPLSHYYIFTGHNSYLTGNQLSSASSEKPIAEALRKGVRVVELDLWPDSQKESVLVYHGRTLTSPVELETCLTAIKENAFVKTDYPVIVTLEDHLPPHLQVTAAKRITEILGSVLFYPEKSAAASGELKEFPSPESLRGKVLISTKPPEEFLRVQPTTAETQTQDDAVPAAAAPEDEENKAAGGGNNVTVVASSSENTYGRLISIRAGKPKGTKSLVEALKVEEGAEVRRVSLSEPELAEVAKSHPEAVVRFTHGNFLRVYPYGLRFDSSNYDPFLAWAHGAQMVAANMQGYGRHLWVMQGFFKANGGCGYVKKPPFLLPAASTTLEASEIFVSSMCDADNPLPVKQTLKVKICTGYGWLQEYGAAGLDTFSEPDFYACVGIAGIEADTVTKKTRTIEESWVPAWEEEFEFCLRVPEIAVLQVEVYDDDSSARDDFAGQIVVPVSELKPGYRVVTMCDEKGEEMKRVKLLFHLQIHENSQTLG